jgi:hypothetical protein
MYDAGRKFKDVGMVSTLSMKVQAVSGPTAVMSHSARDTGARSLEPVVVIMDEIILHYFLFRC